MSGDRQVRFYDYVNAPYDRVRDAVCSDAPGVLQSATRAAASRVENIVSDLKFNIGSIEIGTDVSITVNDVEERFREATEPPCTVMRLEWQAVKAPHLFPLMAAELSVYPLTATETQLDFLGRYEPPFGVFGDAANAMIGHRVASACVHRFLGELAKRLRLVLAPEWVENVAGINHAHESRPN